MRNLIIGIGVIILLVAGFLVVRNTQVERDTYTLEESREIARDWVLNESPTYTFDGMDLILEDEEVREEGIEYSFLFSFDSRGGGYGDRAEEVITQAITPHVIQVVVSEGEVVSAITDGVYDEMRGEMVDETEMETRTVDVYFVRVENGQEEVVAVERNIPANVAVGRGALEALLEGPTAAEEAEGLTTAINEGVNLQSLTIEGGVARADFDGRLQEEIAGSAMVMTIIEQIEQTLLQFDTVNEVIISINGETEEVLQP